MTTRGPKADHLLIRLAGEGVPVAVIARALRLPFAEVKAVIATAAGPAHLIDMPADDWLPGARVRALPPITAEARLRYQRMAGRLQHALAMTSCEALFTAVLVEDGIASLPALCAIAIPRSLAGAEIVKVHACRVRRKLTPHGVRIETLWGRGYRMPDASRALVRRVAGIGASGGGDAEAA